MVKKCVPDARPVITTLPPAIEQFADAGTQDTTGAGPSGSAALKGTVAVPSLETRYIETGMLNVGVDGRHEVGRRRRAFHTDRCPGNGAHTRVNGQSWGTGHRPTERGGFPGAKFAGVALKPVMPGGLPTVTVAVAVADPAVLVIGMMIQSTYRPVSENLAALGTVVLIYERISGLAVIRWLSALCFRGNNDAA